MKLKGKVEKFRIRFDSADVLDIDIKEIKDFTCSDVYDCFDLNSKFDEYECEYLFLSIFKKADKFVNKGSLKGTLFSVIKKNIISWIEIYTTEEKYKLYVVQDIIDSEYVMDVSTGKSLSQKNGYGDSFNLAQMTGEDDKGNLVLLISQETAENAYNDDEEEDYYD